MSESDSKKLVGVDLLIQSIKKQSDQLTQQINQIMEHSHQSTSGIIELLSKQGIEISQNLIKELRLFEANISPYKTLYPTKEFPEISTNISLLEKTLDKEKSESHESSEIIFLLNNLNKDVQEILTQLEEIKLEKEKPTKKEESNKRGANPATIEKLKTLANYRQDQIDKGGEPLNWTKSCELIGIDPKTAKKYAPELRAKWDNLNFQWKSEL